MIRFSNIPGQKKLFFSDCIKIVWWMKDSSPIWILQSFSWNLTPQGLHLKIYLVPSRWILLTAMSIMAIFVQLYDLQWNYWSKEFAEKKKKKTKANFQGLRMCSWFIPIAFSRQENQANACNQKWVVTDTCEQVFLLFSHIKCVSAII